MTKWRALLAGVLVFALCSSSYAFTIRLVAGWTSPIDFQIQTDGSALDLTGMTVELILYASDGTTIDTSGDITVFDATAGKVRYSPDAADLDDADSPLASRFKVTDGVGNVAYMPNGRMDRWVIQSR